MAYEKKVPYKVEAELKTATKADADLVAVRSDKATYFITDTGKTVRCYVKDNGDGTFSWALEEVTA